MMGQWCAGLPFGQNCLTMHISCPLFQPEWFSITQKVFGGQAREDHWTLLSVLLPFLWLSPSLTALGEKLATLDKGPELMLYNLVMVSAHFYTTLMGSRGFPFPLRCQLTLTRLAIPFSPIIVCFFFFETEKNSLWNSDWSGISFVD